MDNLVCCTSLERCRAIAYNGVLGTSLSDSVLVGYSQTHQRISLPTAG